MSYEALINIDPNPDPDPDPNFFPISNLTTNSAVLALEKLYYGATYKTLHWDHAPYMREAHLKPIFNKEAANKLLADLDNGKTVYIDYFQDHCIKVEMTSTGIITNNYDFNHGLNHAKKVLEKMSYEAH
jgi:hypothetical protein